MIRKSVLLISMIIVLSTAGCVKETYDMRMLSKKMHLSPTIAISGIKGDTISLKDLKISNDTIVFDTDHSVKIIIKKESVIDLKLTDFIALKKGTLVQLSASIDPQTLNLGIDDILSNITGDIFISNPSIKLIYTNSFAYPIQIILNASGISKTKTVNLNLAPFNLKYPVAPVTEISDSFTIDKNNSSLPLLMSLPPNDINFSGTAVMDITGKNSQQDSYLLTPNRLIGSLEVEVPLEFRTNNLKFTKTVDNFLKDDTSSNSNSFSAEDFEFLRVDFTAKNGFPLGLFLKMSLYDSSTHSIKSTVDATDIIKPAPVDSNGKSTGTTETSTSINFTKTFFSSVNKADKIIFDFIFNTTDAGSKDVKIYSDYKIDFKAALVMKPDFNLK